MTASRFTNTDRNEKYRRKRTTKVQLSKHLKNNKIRQSVREEFGRVNPPWYSQFFPALTLSVWYAKGTGVVAIACPALHIFLLRTNLWCQVFKID